MRVAHEQPPPGCLLQLADVLADGGLPQAKPPPRLAEIARLRHRQEALQQYRIEHGAIPVITIHDNNNVTTMLHNDHRRRDIPSHGNPRKAGPHRKTLLSRLPSTPTSPPSSGMVALASALPVHGRGSRDRRRSHHRAIALMFFLQGARLAPRRRWPVPGIGGCMLVVLVSTFLLFPAIGLAARALAPDLLTPALWAGVLMLCVLPSTVQSSIAFTSIARGNVPAALCAATASNLFGIALTPLLAGLLLRTQNVFSARGVADIVLQLLLPFAAGQLARPWIGDWVAAQQARHSAWSIADRSCWSSMPPSARA